MAASDSSGNGNEMQWDENDQEVAPVYENDIVMEGSYNGFANDFYDLPSNDTKKNMHEIVEHNDEIADQDEAAVIPSICTTERSSAILESEKLIEVEKE